MIALVSILKTLGIFAAGTYFGVFIMALFYAAGDDNHE